MDEADDVRNEPRTSVSLQMKGPFVRVFLLGSLRLEWQVPPAEPEAAWKGRTSARDLFLLLLCMPERQAPRSLLAGIMWPESPERNARESLRSALKVLRRVLSTADGKVLVESVPHSDVLRLVGQEQMWVDLDAFLSLVEEASQQGETRQALPLWEHARVLLQGELLAGEQRGEWSACKWVKFRRKQFHIARRRMIRHLTQGLLEVGQRIQAEIILSEHVSRYPSDQDALYLLMKLLIEEECYEEALAYYECCERALAAREKQPARHLQALSASVRKLNTMMLRPPHFIQQTQVSQEEENQRAIRLPHTAQVLAHSQFQHEAGMQQQEALQMHLSRRDMLQQVLSFVGTGAISLHPVPSAGSQEVTPETLDYFTALTEICRHLSEGNELRTAEAILWSYLPRVESFVKYSLGEQGRAASIASQGYLLAASLVGHRNDLQARQRYSEKALLYGKLAQDLNLQVVAMRQIAISFDCLRRPDNVLHIYQWTFSSLQKVSPLLRACVYADVSGAHAQLGHKQEASRFIGMAYDHFPEKPEQEPNYLHTICRYSSLVQWEGLNHLTLGKPDEAEAVFARIDGLHPRLLLPERVRVELLNYQVEAFLASGKLDQACTYLEAAAHHASAIGSERLFQEASSLFQQMQTIWQHERQVQRLADLFL